jgi:hypothetical protein
MLSLFAAANGFNKYGTIDNKQHGRLLLLTARQRDGELSLEAAACSSLAQSQSASAIIRATSKVWRQSGQLRAHLLLVRQHALQLLRVLYVLPVGGS